ncbi:MAG: PorV/PorQ family protein [Candidatus Eisenbacteria bacterium]|nr:PorV/PorQ family protein [Candidatus Eisenbacteria bacterium]
MRRHRPFHSAAMMSPLPGWMLVPALLIAASLIVTPQPVEATKYAAEFLKIGAGARPLGMGAGFAALADDASAAYWNPAGLVFMDRSELLFMHAEFLGTLANYDYASFAQPLDQGKRRSAIGVSVARFAVDDIQVTANGYDDLNDNGRYDEGEPLRMDKFYRDSDTEYAVFLTYATAFRPTFRVGGNLKLIRQDLLGTKSFGMGVDLGFLYLASPSLTVGLRLADITTTQISWDTGHNETVNPTATLGFAYSRPVSALQGTVTLTADLATNFEGRKEVSQFGGDGFAGDFNGGVEYWFHKTLALRAGAYAGTFTAGGGLRYRGLGVDYAFVPNDDLDDTHRVSGSINF